jgi:SAM-dependent methyltransferase
MLDDDKFAVAQYFNVESRLAPHVSELLADFWELGSDPALVVSWLRDLDLPRADTRILDLGCGKGAVSLTIARELGLYVDGVDMLPAFIEEARAKAGELGVEQLCKFQVGDARAFARGAKDYRVTLFLSVGDILGSPGGSVATLRRTVVRGGYMLIDDGYLVDSAKVEFPGYDSFLPRDETLRQLTSHGDEIVREHLIPRAAIRSQNERYTRLIMRRAERLAHERPDLANAIKAYLEKERKESLLLETVIQCATWLLRRPE